MKSICGCYLALIGPGLLLLLKHLAEGTLLDHDTHNLVKHVGRSHGRELGVGVVGGLMSADAPRTTTYRNFDNVSSHDVELLKAANDGAKLASGPSAGLGGTGGGGDYRSECTPAQALRSLQAGSSVSMSMER